MNPVILIAEDVLVNRLLVKSYVTIDFPNSKIIEASNGTEAVEATIKYNPEIIFMDLHMPVKNGYQAAQEIREYEKTIKGNKNIIIIALSADATEGVAEKCRLSGMNDYIQKPFKTNDVRAVLKKYFNSGNQQNNIEKTVSVNLPAAFNKSDLLDRINGNIPLFHKLADVAITQLTADLEKLTESIIKKDLQGRLSTGL
jgi:CheY-like chemotaxis protein